jgi:hypothetical protein
MIHSFAGPPLRTWNRVVFMTDLTSFGELYRTCTSGSLFHLWVAGLFTIPYIVLPRVVMTVSGSIVDAPNRVWTENFGIESPAHI